MGIIFSLIFCVSKQSSDLICFAVMFYGARIVNEERFLKYVDDSREFSEICGEPMIDVYGEGQGWSPLYLIIKDSLICISEDELGPWINSMRELDPINQCYNLHGAIIKNIANEMGFIIGDLDWFWGLDKK